MTVLYSSLSLNNMSFFLAMNRESVRPDESHRLETSAFLSSLFRAKLLVRHNLQLCLCLIRSFQKAPLLPRKKRKHCMPWTSSLCLDVGVGLHRAICDRQSADERVGDNLGSGRTGVSVVVRVV